MKLHHCILALFSIALTLSPLARAQDYQLVWSDEFNYTGLPDPTKWDYDASPPGGPNHELQNYTAYRWENARVENGKLIIEARRDWFQGYEFSSAKLVTRYKGQWRYGKVEVCAKLPWGNGTWPAIWMLPIDWSYGDWPNSGEIDLMEHVGFNMDIVKSGIHCDRYNFRKPVQDQRNADTWVPGVAEGFHIYRLEWTPNSIIVSVDNQAAHFVYNNEGIGWTSWPFDRRFYLLLNFAVGGDWGGAEGVDRSLFPSRMEVAWVRVYQLPFDARTIVKDTAHFDEMQGGAQVEPCSEGGLDVGWLDRRGAWMKYLVNVVAAGSYRVEYRVASMNGNGEIALDLNSGSAFLGSVPVPQTYGWQNWTTISHNVSLGAGWQDLAIYVNRGGFNVNWMKITPNF
jgi:beta-glucanase (GH16 family)